MEARDSQGASPLHRRRGTRISKSYSYYSTVVRPIMAGDNQGASPLHVASRYGLIDVVQLLLNRGAAIMAGDNTGSFPLTIASRYGRNRRRAAITQPWCGYNHDNQGASPLHIASTYGIIDHRQTNLIDFGAN